MLDSFNFPQCDDSEGYDNRDVSELLNNSDDVISDTLAGFLESQGVNVGELERVQNVIRDRADRRGSKS